MDHRLHSNETTGEVQRPPNSDSALPNDGKKLGGRQENWDHGDGGTTPRQPLARGVTTTTTHKAQLSQKQEDQLLPGTARGGQLAPSHDEPNDGMR